MYEISLPVFQGPLDLLLHLIERQELDITTVSLVEVTEQYLEYLHSGDQIDPDPLADFIVIGAKLLFIKSQSLLPSPAQATAEEKEAEEVGEELVRQLLDYKRFKEAAQELMRLEEEGWRSYPRLAPPPQLPPAAGLKGITGEALLAALRRALERHREEPEGVVEGQAIRIEDKMADIEAALAGMGRVSFEWLMEACRSRKEIIVCFLALLELLRLHRVEVAQEERFGEIVVLAV